MSRRRTAAQIMTDALRAGQFAGHEVNRSRQWYEATFRGRIDIPSYGHFRKEVRLSRSRVLTDSANWERLPDSFDALYYLSFIDDESILGLLNSGAVCKTTSLERVKELLIDYQNQQNQIEQDALQKQIGQLREKRMAELDEQLRQSVTHEIVAQLLATDDLKAALEDRIAKKKEQFCREHPDLDEYFKQREIAKVNRLSRRKRPSKSPVEIEARQMVDELVNSGRVCLDGFSRTERQQYIRKYYDEAMQSIMERKLPPTAGWS